MDAYRCRVCGHTTSNVSEMANCGNCGAIASMLANTPREPDTVRIPRECPDAVIEALANWDLGPGDVASFYAKIVAIAGRP